MCFGGVEVILKESKESKVNCGCGVCFATCERGEVTEDDCHVAALLAMTVVYMRVYKSIPANMLEMCFWLMC